MNGIKREIQSEKRILIVENLFPLQTRSLRIESSLKKLGYDVSSIMWNRNAVEVKESIGHLVYTKVARNKIKKLFSIFSYYLFIKKTIRTDKYDILIASHWDMLFLCFFLRKKSKLVYDNLDMPTHKLFLIRKLFRLIEIIGLKRTDAIIYASRFFKEFYNDKTPSIIFENKPLRIIEKGFIEKPKTKVINIAFLGTLRYSDSLKILIDAVGNLSGYNLTIKGSGFAKDLIEYTNSKNYSNVSLEVGWYNYNDLGKLFNKVDLVWAAYPNKDFNVKYAISNKFFESLLFNKPCIYSENTELGNFVESEGLGLTVNPYDKKAIELLLVKILKNELISSIKQNQKSFIKDKHLFWEDDEEKLIELINKLY